MRDEAVQKHAAGKRPVIMVNEADVVNNEQETQNAL
jgi:hypothetical protein